MGKAINGETREIINSILQADEEQEMQLMQGGSQKLSDELLEQMGVCGVSKLEMDTLIFLAKHQNKEGKAYCNLHIIQNAIHCSKSSFMDLMHKLEAKGLITYKRSADARTCKTGVYEVTLVHNNFLWASYKDQTYTRLNHCIFSTEKFMGLPPVGKFIMITVIRDLDCLDKDELGARKHATAELDYEWLMELCMDWNGCAKRTFLYSLKKVRKNYHVTFEKRYNPDKRRPTKHVVFRLDNEDIRFGDSDNFTMLGNITNAAFEEKGLHTSDIKGLGAMVTRHMKKAKESIEKAKKQYRNGASIPDDNKKARKKKAKYSEPLLKIIGELEQCPLDQVGLEGGSGYKHSTIISRSCLPGALRLLLAKGAYCYEWAVNSIKARKQKVEDFRVMDIASELMCYAFSNRHLSTERVSSIIFRYKA